MCLTPTCGLVANQGACVLKQPALVLERVPKPPPRLRMVGGEARRAMRIRRPWMLPR